MNSEPRHPTDMPDLDEAVFDRLLVMAGAELADDLVNHFTKDLSAAKERLMLGMGTQDWHVLRESSHVLIALAGTAGANRLQSDATKFNKFANDQSFSKLDEISEDLISRVNALISFINSRSGARRSAP